MPRTKAVVVCWSCILSLFAHAQTPEQPRQFIFRTGTRMVHVNVIVQDGNGRPVANLEKADFILKDAGKIQEIRSFSVETKSKAFPETPALPRGVFTNRLAGGTPTSVTVIVLDALNTRWADQVYAASAVVEFLQQIRPADPVAVYVLGREFRVVHEFTSDPALLLKALAGYRALPGQDDLETLAKPALRGLLDLFAKQRGYLPDIRISASMLARFAIANHLAGLPRRKNMLWVSGSLPAPLDEGGVSNPYSNWDFQVGWKPARPMVRKKLRPIPPAVLDLEEAARITYALNHANIAEYPVDASGLTLKGGSWESRNGMNEEARRTGGRAFADRNDLMRCISDAVADSAITYELAYYPSEVLGDGRFREIKVEVKRKSVTVRHRTGYFDLRGPAHDTQNVVKALRDAAWGPLDATGLWLEARCRKVVEGDEQKLLVETKVDPANVTLGPDGDRWRGHLEYLFIQKDQNGEECGTTGSSMRLDLRDETYRQVLKNGLVHQTPVSYGARAQTLRVVVSDVQSGRTGSVTIPLHEIALDAAGR